ncbi:MAG: XTP/dITP diphosphatase [Chloroflexi bacterium]|nr:XTP/dITP diphosphatase [Chloroflexota bacterium]
MPKLLIATHNPGKIREYQTLLADLPLTVTSLRAEGIEHDVEETGVTFAENAILKAKAYGQLSGLWTWADDSGLEVDALEGRPGVYSARYAGPNTTDQDRYQKLLGELSQLPDQPRTARFRCVIALALSNGEIHTIDDTIEGVISMQPSGEHGFGYDPVFFIPELGKTLAELPAEVKNQISHRGKAAARAKEFLYTQFKR